MQSEEAIAAEWDRVRRANAARNPGESAQPAIEDGFESDMVML